MGAFLAPPEALFLDADEEFHDWQSDVDEDW